MLLVLALLLPLYSIAADVDCEKYENMKWTPADRQGILKVHNELRKKIREGNFVAGNGKDKKAAAKEGTMPDLTYNCTMEMSAQKWADTCNKNFADNSAWFTKDQSDFTGVGEEASRMWEQQLLTNRWQCNMIKQELWDNQGEQYKNGAGLRMAWAKTTQIGCGVNLCPTKTKPEFLVVCEYWPKGRILGELVYETADGVQPPCSPTSSTADEDQSPPASSPPSDPSAPSEYSKSSTTSESSTKSASSIQLPLLCLLFIFYIFDK